MPLPSPTMTSAVKLKRRPPLTTLATRLMATTRSSVADLSWAPPRPPPWRSRPPWPPPSRRWVPGIRRPSVACSSYEGPSERQAPLSGRVRELRDAAVVAASAAVDHDRVDPPRLGGRGGGPADLGGL